METPSCAGFSLTLCQVAFGDHSSHWDSHGVCGWHQRDPWLAGAHGGERQPDLGSPCYTLGISSPALLMHQQAHPDHTEHPHAGCVSRRVRSKESESRPEGGTAGELIETPVMSA